MNTHEPYIFNLPNIGSADIGKLTFLEGVNLPFVVRRVYWTVDVPSDKIRGHHAHHKLEQIIVAMHGALDMTIETSARVKYNFLLDNPHIGLYIPQMCWREIKFKPDSVLLCLASLEYNEYDYIRSYYDFENITKHNNY